VSRCTPGPSYDNQNPSSVQVSRVQLVQSFASELFPVGNRM